MNPIAYLDTQILCFHCNTQKIKKKFKEKENPKI